MLETAAVLLIKPAIKVANKLLKPLVDQLSEVASTKMQLAYHHLFNSYTQYLTNSYDRYSYFTSIVFKNEQKKLEDYYLPLTLLLQPTNIETKIESYPKALIDNYQKVLIVDTAGMGKTTLLKYMFLRCVEEEAGIPIYIELRKLSKKATIINYMTDQLSDIQGKCNSDLLFELMKSGSFVFFFDGYDEIPENVRPEVTSSLQKFIEKAPKNKFVISSREENGLVAFPQFQRFIIRPLQKQEAYDLLKKYADPAISETLINKLEQPEYGSIHEFLTNPLLTSLLYKSFEYKRAIPLKRHIFYDQVYEALYEAHDLTKEGGEYQRTKRSGLDLDRFEHILRALGVLTYRNDKIEFSKNELSDYIDKAKKILGENKVVTSNIIHDLTHAVPLMVEDGNYIRWSHKSFQEYFAAQYICKHTNGKQKEILLKYANNREFTKHLNLIILCADIDRSSFRQSIGKNIVEELLYEYKALYKKGFTSIPKDWIEERKELSVGRKLFFIRFEFDVEPGVSDFDLINKMVQPIQEEMKNQAGIQETFSVNISLSDPGIGKISTLLDHLIENLHLRTDMPFIQVCHSVLPPSSLEDHVDKNIKVKIINDDEVSPLNDAKNFQLVNALIKRHGGWRFNAKLAKSFLAELANESKSQAELLEW